MENERAAIEESLKFLKAYGKEGFFENLNKIPFPPKFEEQRRMDMERDLAPFGEQAETRLNSVKDAEQDRFQKMRMLNGNTFNTGERSQGDQEAEQRMNQNEKTSILQKVGNFLSSPFTKTFGTEDQPKFNGQDGVMYNGKMVHPDFYKLMMNRSDLKNKFDSTGSIYD